MVPSKTGQQDSVVKGGSGPWADLSLTLPVFLGYHLGVVFYPIRNAADVVTRELMADFYRALGASGIPSGGFRGAEALRRAQLERVREERRLHLSRPLLWANFVFSGVL